MDRRRQISAAAFASIAERGFEGLRMRDVAERAGVNIATVHYYYASKEELIRAAYGELQSRFQATVPAEGDPAERLTGHLHEVRDLLLGDDDLRSVLAEIALRARRDEQLGAAIAGAEAAWLAQLQHLLRAGAASGSWALPVDPVATAAMVVTLCKGACMPALATSRRDELVAAFDQLLGWLAPSPRGRHGQRAL